jgi:hypothetical protein
MDEVTRMEQLLDDDVMRQHLERLRAIARSGGVRCRSSVQPRSPGVTSKRLRHLRDSTASTTSVRPQVTHVATQGSQCDAAHEPHNNCDANDSQRDVDSGGRHDEAILKPVRSQRDGRRRPSRVIVSVK